MFSFKWNRPSRQNVERTVNSLKNIFVIAKVNDVSILITCKINTGLFSRAIYCFCHVWKVAFSYLIPCTPTRSQLLTTLNQQNGCSGSLAQRSLQIEKKPKLAIHCYVPNHFSRFFLLLGLASSYGPLKRGGERPGTE